ncbi:hypothetical protein BFP72_06360 [Reichenbachiella sp. 5M10]|uniref:CHAT domain-containing protein n=1 Tax=Reichenbachiella sp. 5M10 TaxID=1889772 RepID=UPI000C152499|nr:CHAT domain-containing protein [Reichenbachiella sp. 5M10]PIB35044.1 hypothetical protein BFP72_06360 [Reichenbachiella sp. 5M10]
MSIGFKGKCAVILLLWGYCTIESVAQDYEAANQLLLQARYEEAYEQFDALTRQYQASEASEAYIQCNLKLAECDLGRGKVDACIWRAQQTMEIIRDRAEDTVFLMAHTRMLLGNGFLHIGRNDLALEQLLLAEPGLAPRSVEIAECYENIGIAYWDNGNSELALQYHEKALTIRQQKQVSEDALGDSNNNIGLVYLKDEPLQSLIYFKRALAYYTSSKITNDRKIALCYTNLAFAQAELQHYPEALDYLNQIDQIWADVYPGDHANKAFVLSSRGRVFKMKGELDQALDYQKQALGMYVRLYGDKHPDVANTYFLIGQIRQEQREFESAAIHYQQSIYANLFDQESLTMYDLPRIENYYNANILLSSLQAKAKAMEAYHFERTLKMRDIDGALQLYLLSDELIGQIRQTRINEVDKLRLSAIASQVYENGITIAKYLSEHSLRKRHYLDIAFEFSERSKAAVLLEAINETKAKHFAGIPDEALHTEDSLKDEIDYLEQMLVQKEVSEADRQDFKERLFSNQSMLRDFVAQLEQDYPSYYQLKYNRELVSVDQLQAQLRPGEWVLSYVLGDKELFIFSITQDRYELITLDKGDKFEQKIVGLRNTIKYQMQGDFEPLARELYDMLIPKIPRGTMTLTVLPAGILSVIPFESLVVSDEGDPVRYLIEDVAVNYDYSATLLSQTSQQTVMPEDKVLLVAPVDFVDRAGVASLPDTRVEVREIEYLFKGNNAAVEMMLETNATEGNLKHKLESNYKYVHLATHGKVNESMPALSQVYLNKDDHDDGSLYCSEIYNMHIDSDLVSLSACETALGKISKGEGVIGLSRALKYAGVQNLMVSLWQVNDHSTADLMISFYKNHLYHSDRAGYSDDLRKAKLELIRSGNFAAPYYWAPFVLVGK